MQWICADCLRGKKNNSSDKKLDILINKIVSLEKQVTAMKEQLSGPSLDEKIEKAVARKVAEVVEERVDIEKREKNIIVYGLSETDRENPALHDKTEIVSLIKIMDPSLGNIEINDVSRIGKKIDGKDRLVRFKVSDINVKKTILKNAYKVNKNGNKKIYFNPDLTPAQREKDKRLREELKQRRADTGNRNLIIKNGEIVERRVRGNEGEDI